MDIKKLFLGITLVLISPLSLANECFWGGAVQTIERSGSTYVISNGDTGEGLAFWMGANGHRSNQVKAIIFDSLENQKPITITTSTGSCSADTDNLTVSLKSFY